MADPSSQSALRGVKPIEVAPPQPQLLKSRTEWFNFLTQGDPTLADGRWDNPVLAKSICSAAAGMASDLSRSGIKVAADWLDESMKTSQAHLTDDVRADLRRIADVARTMRRMSEPNFGLGRTVSDEEYLAEAAKHINPPEEFDVADGVWARLQQRNIPGVRQAISDLNKVRADPIIFLEYIGTTSGAVDNRERFLMYVPSTTRPGDGLYLQASSSGQDISAIAVELPRNGEQNGAWFMDLRIVEGKIVKPGKPIFFNSCSNCHVQRRPMHLFPEAKNPVDTSSRLALNKIISGYPKSLRTKFDELDAGLDNLHIGIQTNVEDLPPRILAAARCQECHDSETAPPLTGYSGKRMIQIVVEAGWMPPGSDLTKPERDVLLEALFSDYCARLTADLFGRFIEPSGTATREDAESTGSNLLLTKPGYRQVSTARQAIDWHALAKRYMSDSPQNSPPTGTATGSELPPSHF